MFNHFNYEIILMVGLVSLNMFIQVMSYAVCERACKRVDIIVSIDNELPNSLSVI